ncbi:iron-containing alcohol dehydrogenase family protein [Fervidibacillus albus]|uniref:Iron-containing alcohol dehydrogenase n=1 Tax=Fervidibacillus albus TaxID=2980026 RepID=A0A9E8LT29_9BACI|nr:iron-containing alcohol dehydrogenase [Fervidibacillus albus]WAA09102.1 iron-containing alcohol dehydrogenase [Fervidibacillus albus]
MSTVHLPKTIIAENGSFNQIRKVMHLLGIQKPFIVMDSFLTKPPIQLKEQLQNQLKDPFLRPTFFSDFSGEPNTLHVQSALELLKSSDCDGVVAVGGGSAIDLSKAVSLFGKNKGFSWEDIESAIRLERLPLIAVPTTAGTGSEATGIMVITDTQKGIKMNPKHSALIPDVAILDPQLTISLPKAFTSFTGMDALTHAIEAYLSNRATAMSDFYALKAIEMIRDGLPNVMEDGKNIRAREKMIVASCYAGIAFNNSSTNLAHAAGRALGARFHIPHGLSVALLLPFVMEFSLASCSKRLQKIASLLSGRRENEVEPEQAIRIIENYNEQFGIWEAGQNYLNKHDQVQKAIPLLIEDALSGNGILTNRQVPAREDIEQIYLSLLEKLGEMKTVSNV